MLRSFFAVERKHHLIKSLISTPTLKRVLMQLQGNVFIIVWFKIRKKNGKVRVRNVSSHDPKKNERFQLFHLFKTSQHLEGD